MKRWMLALSFIAALGFAGLADAKVKGGKGGMKGKIESVTGNTFTMTMPSRQEKCRRCCSRWNGY